MIEEEFDPAAARRQYEADVEREAARIREQEEQLNYLFGSQFDRMFKRYLNMHGCEHALDMMDMSQIIQYVQNKEGEIIEDLNKRRTEAEKKLQKAEDGFGTDRYIANLYWESLLKLFGYATDENNRFTAEEWENAVVDEFDKCFLTQMEIEDEAEKKMIAQAMAEEENDRVDNSVFNNLSTEVD